VDKLLQVHYCFTLHVSMISILFSKKKPVEQ